MDRAAIEAEAREWSADERRALGRYLIELDITPIGRTRDGEPVYAVCPGCDGSGLCPTCGAAGIVGP